MSQKILSGLFLYPRFKKYLAKLQGKKILLIRGKQSYISSGLDVALKPILWRKAPECYEVKSFIEFAENPQYDDLMLGLKIAREFNPDIIIAAGGGSVIDMGKLIRFFFYRDCDIANYSTKTSNIRIPLIAIPTTAGSGAEATHFSVLYKDKIKYSIAHKEIVPDCILLEPKFTYSLNPFQTACTGFDAFSQAVESYWSVSANKVSEKIAWKALRIALKNLPLLISNPRPILRRRILKASYLAGKAINMTKTTAPHAFSYYFTTEFGIPHGQAVSLTFPFFMKFNYINHKLQAVDGLDINIHKSKMIKLYKLFRVKTPLEAYEYMINFLKQINLYSNLSQYSEQEIFNNVNIERLNNNPRRFLVYTFLDIDEFEGRSI